MDDSSKIPATQDDLESIINRLNFPGDGFPADAIEEARTRSHEITPLLINLIEDATRNCELGYLEDCWGHFCSVYLLAEFRAVEAWPAIRKAISLPADKTYELFGDAITENFACVISTLTGDRLDEIEDFLDDTSLDAYVRWAALDTVLYRIRDGILTREEAIEWLSEHLEKAIENEDKIAECLVVRLEELAAENALPLIEKAYAKNLIDDEFYPISDVKMSIARGDEIFNETIAELQHPDNLIDNLSQWKDFNDVDSDWENEIDLFTDDPTESLGSLDAVVDDYISENDTTIRNDGIKVGRNEKCPCGSGKKYKKCCGRRSSLDG